MCGPGHVDVEQPGPLVVGEGLHGAEELHPDVREHEVGDAEARLDGCGRGLHAGGLGNVGHQAERVDAVRFPDARRLGGGALAVEVEQRDVHAERRARLTEGQTESRRPAGDDGNGHQRSSGTTKSACRRVSFDDVIRQAPARFS